MTINSDALAGLTINLNIVQGKDLVAKDRGAFGFGAKKASDPFIRIHVNGKQVGYTEKQKKTVNPEWNQELTFNFWAAQVASIMENKKPIELKIFNHDKMSFLDPMVSHFVLPLQENLARFGKSILTLICFLFHFVCPRERPRFPLILKILNQSGSMSNLMSAIMPLVRCWWDAKSWHAIIFQ